MNKKGTMNRFPKTKILNRYLSLILVATCIATMAWLFAAPAPAKAAEAPTLVAVDITPATVWKGSSVTMYYTIDNPGSTSVNIQLGAFGILQSPYWELKDLTTYVVSVAPGTATYQRTFQTQADTPAGAYVIYWTIWDELSGTQLGWNYRYPGLTVVDSPTVTLCFDDGYDSVYQTAYPIVNSFDFQATVFQVTGLSSLMEIPLMSVSQLRTLHSAGWEIASHTVDHQDLVGMSQEALHAELADSKAWLESNGFGPVNALAYPFGQANEIVYAAAGNYYKYARTIIPGVNNHAANLGLNTALLWGNSSYNSLAEVENIVNQAIAGNQWAIITIHGVTADSNDPKVNSTYDWATTDVLTSLLQFLQNTGVPVKTFAQLEGNAAPVNHAPVSSPDSYTTNKNDTLTVAAPGVLANDTDSDGNTLTAAEVTGPAHGTFSLNADGSFTYTPATGYYGSDSFTYTAGDGKVISDTATVTITVTNVNHPPVANNDVYSVDKGTVLTVTAPGVLGNDTDADGDTLSAVKLTDPSHGSLTFNSDGSFIYTPVSTYTGPDSFTYRANDGADNSNTATVAITVTPPAGSTSTFGLDSGAGSFYSGSDQLQLQRFQNTAGDGTLIKLEVLIDAYYGGKVKLAVYADDGGVPGALLLDAGEVDGANGWVAISSLNLPVANGAHYWLAFTMSAANILPRQIGPANTHWWMNQAYSVLPAVFPAFAYQGGYDSGVFVMRATVTRP